MLAATLFFAVFAYISLADVTTIYHEGQFSGLLYDSALWKKEGQSMLSFAYYSQACLSALSVETSQDTTAVLETIIRQDEGEFVWGEVSRTEIVNGKGSFPLTEEQCASRFRISIVKGDFVDVSSTAREVNLDLESSKRIVTCAQLVNGQSLEGTWPTACGTAPGGQYCLPTTRICGCLQDADCYGNTVLPYCNTTTSACQACTTVPTTGTGRSVLSIHYFCRSRYPTRYITDPTLNPRPPINRIETIAGERVPGVSEADPLDPVGGFFREICSSQSPDPAVPKNANIGSCERCNQASYLANVRLPNYNFPVTAANPNPNEGPKGTYFCRYIRGTPQTGINDNIVIASRPPAIYRPICSSLDYFQAVGMGDLFTRALVSEEILSIGLNSIPSVPLQQDVVIERTVDQWEGACVPCALKVDGTTRAYHGLCSYALTLSLLTGQEVTISSPICKVDTGGCAPCASNADCALGSDPSDANKPFFTGGRNCYADGRCHTCTSNADCAGDLGNQNICTDGICVDPIPCSGNNGQTNQGANPCPTAAAPNCYTDGSCKDCRVSGCGNDLNGQTVCDQSNGICKICTINNDCGTGLNCQADGTCKDCTTGVGNSLCGTGIDGGSDGTSCAVGAFCLNRNNQPLCNPSTKRCEDICTSNDFCGSRQNVISIGGGLNCQASGFCLSCSPANSGSPTSPAATCGTLDGPQTGIAGYAGITGETNCGPSGLCFNPQLCTANANCGTSVGGRNCQVTGGCVDCTVTYTDTTCGVGKDGGEIISQPNCDQSSRQCVRACNSEADCAGTQGANCMANGVCFDCRTNADCTTGNAWNGDRLGRTLCNTATRLCYFACDSNYAGSGNHPCPAATPNCNADGNCVSCTNDAGCAANDGPPGTPAKNIQCSNSGVCVDPWLCTTGGPGGGNADNSGCQAYYADNSHANCNLDGTCSNCVDNAWCQQRDGGLIPYQPRCDTSTRVCTSCQSNADCPATAANCMWDGSCQDCRKRIGTNVQQCGGPNVDGPPGTTHPNPNCDSVTGICVDFCTRDADCLDACKPRCQLERGCCVECLGDAHCPVPQWRGVENRTKTQCDIRNGYQCVYPVACTLDEDCTDPAKPACSYSENKCVECKSDTHCAGNEFTKACDVGRQVCVQCISNSHCLLGWHMCDPRTNYCVLASATGLSASLFLSMIVLLISHF